ncbi:MAG: hypothetical protein GY898_14265 [Proteobacteria bacterium]|nr:hypothetical protein [Pseudomonadota bacterium]
MIPDGETVENIIDWEPVASADVAATTFTAEWFVEGLDTDSNGACAFDVACGSGELDLDSGDHLTCDVTNNVVFDACTFIARVTVNVTAYDSAICSDALYQQELTAGHAG